MDENRGAGGFDGYYEPSMRVQGVRMIRESANSRHVHYILNIIGCGLTSNGAVYLFGVRQLRP